MSYSGDIAHAYLLRRALYLEDELDALLDESWLNEGLERLSTVEAITETLSALSTAGASSYAQIAALESTWYMRNQLLRDTDWSSMAHGLEVRVPFVDTRLLERLGPAIASSAPPTKQDLAACAAQLHPEMHSASQRPALAIPVREWIGSQAGRIRTRAARMGRHRASSVSHHPAGKSGANVRLSLRNEMTSALRMLMLLTDGFGGVGGIAKFNRDFLQALDACDLVERVQALPRLIAEPIKRRASRKRWFTTAKLPAGRRLSCFAWEHIFVGLVGWTW